MTFINSAYQDVVIGYPGCEGDSAFAAREAFMTAVDIWRNHRHLLPRFPGETHAREPQHCCWPETWKNHVYYSIFGWGAQLRRTAKLIDYLCAIALTPDKEEASYFDTTLEHHAWLFDAKIHPNFISGLQKAWENFLFIADIPKYYKGSRIDHDCSPEEEGAWRTWEMGLWENYPRRDEVTQRQLELVKQGNGRWQSLEEWAEGARYCQMTVDAGKGDEYFKQWPILSSLYEWQGLDHANFKAEQLNPSPWARCFMDHYNPRWDKPKTFTLSQTVLKQFRDQEKAKLAADIRQIALKSPAFRKKTLKTATTPDSDEELVVASPHLTEADTDTGQPERNIIPYIAVGLLACGIIGGSIYFYYKKDNKKGRSK